MGRFDDHYARMESGLVSLAARNAILLDEDGITEVRGLIEAREYGLAYEVLAAAFARHPSLIDEEDLTKLQRLAEAMHIETLVLD